MNKLPVTNILASAFILPWKKRAHFSYALAMPTLVLVSVWAIWLAISPKDPLYNYIIYSIYLIAFVYFAITCHRLILVENEPKIQLGTNALKIIITFSAWMLFLYFLSIAIEYIFINIYINFGTSTSVSELTEEAVKQHQKQTHRDIQTAEYLFYLPAMYFFGRFSLVLPATAIGIKSGLKWSWVTTKHNGLRILAIVGAFPWALQALLWLLQRDNSTAIEQSVIGLLMYLSAAIGIFALSLTYKTLCSNE